MSEAEYVFDATRENFAAEVVDKSLRVPVLVDFWADWCRPCHMLAPVLEKLAAEYAGKVLVAKVDTEAQPDIAAQFDIRGLPTVKLFKNGGVVDEFVGVLTESAIRELLERYVEHESELLTGRALEALQVGKGEEARELMQKAMAADPDNPRVKLGLAAMHLHTGELEKAQTLLQELPVNLREETAAKVLRAQIEFGRAIEDAPDIAALQRKIGDDPGDLISRYQLGVRNILTGDFESGLEQMLEIMKRDRNFRDDIGRKSALSVFEMLGSNHPLVGDCRRKMAAMLY